MSTTRVFSRELEPYRHSGGVHEALVEMFQGFGRIFFGLETNKAELTELPVLGELQRAVCHGAKGSKHRPEPLLLHLHTSYTVTGVLKQNVTLTYLMTSGCFTYPVREVFNDEPRHCCYLILI